MDQRFEARSLKPLIWGLFLIALGGLFLFERFDLMSLHSIGRYWPVILIMIGISQLTERRFGSSINYVLSGFWFLAVQLHWYGLTYRNSWPLLLVGIGAGMVVRSLSGEDAYRKAKKKAEKGEAS
jgi:hypothetical protein